MWNALKEWIGGLFDDIGYNSRRFTALAAGKIGIKSGAEAVEFMGGVALGTAGRAAMLLAIPVSAGLSAALVQGDHIHNLHRIRREYTPEIAAWTGKGKTGEPLTDKDMMLAARGDKARGIPGNPALAEAIDQSAKRRNWSIGISAFSTLAGSLAVFAMKKAEWFKPLIDAVPEGAAATAVGVLAAGAVGVALYYAIKIPTHFIAEKLFGLEKETVDDKIHGISRALGHGRDITREQVFDVFLEAHPELDRQIRAQEGKRFHTLPQPAKESVMDAFGPHIKLDEYTAAINQRLMRPEELAFASFGQKSGVEQALTPPPAPARRSVMDSIKTAALGAFSRLRRKHAPEPVVVQVAAANDASDAPAYAAVAAHSKDGNTQVEAEALSQENNRESYHFRRMAGGSKLTNGETKFANRVECRQGKDGSLSFVESAASSSVTFRTV